MRLSKYTKELMPHYERSGTWVPSYVNISHYHLYHGSLYFQVEMWKKKEKIEQKYVLIEVEMGQTECGAV